MSRPLVVFTDDTVRPEAAALLAPTCDVRMLAAYPPEAVLADACRDAHAILARLGTVTRKVIEGAPKLRIIARHGVGVDAVDLAAATARGIVVTTTGGENAVAVAEYTFALLLGLLRSVPRADREMREGAWARNPLVGGELDGRTIGIIGLGAIGRRVARQGRGFAMRVLAFDPALPHAPDPDAELVSFDRLLAESDVVTIHTRLTANTAGMMNAAAFAAMKPTAVFVNTARGEVVDEPALIAALRKGTIAGAALDTYAAEPLSPDSGLRSMPNVLLSPHVAGQTEAALVRVGIAAAQAILDEFAGRRPAFVYNPDAYAVREREVIMRPRVPRREKRRP